MRCRIFSTLAHRAYPIATILHPCLVRLKRLQRKTSLVDTENPKRISFRSSRPPPPQNPKLQSSCSSHSPPKSNKLAQSDRPFIHIQTDPSGGYHVGDRRT
ncbi:hypothetical protein CKAH01_05676 [Colletotrichum kahawae]|uniref:Uncharacterized protein n=1 Tax=Colletotrichum kahawae TaxID=34407 RepID=A0AAD9YDR2_COLKA|nr:hypothetical protein CKAH01_05676 [Colletotrichum kahawae]